MADVFVSYAHEDRDTALRLTSALKSENWSVWMDTELIPGDIFTDEIEQKLRTALVVVVLWSHHACESDWVKNEAYHAWQKGTALPVQIDNAELPNFFERTLCVNLADWRSEKDHFEFKRLVEAIEKRVAHSVTTAGTSAPLYSNPFFRGREQDLLEIKNLFLGPQVLPIAVVGPGGVGKSSLCEKVLSEPEVVNRYQNRRFHIRLDQCKTAEDMVAEIARKIQTPNLGRPLDIQPIVKVLESELTLLILVDAHWVWIKDKRNFIDIIRNLANIQTVTLTITFSGYSKPFQLQWAHPIIEVHPLDFPTSNNLFLDLCKNVGRDFTNDIALKNIIDLTDGIALSVFWVACHAERCSDLTELYNRWKRGGVDAFENKDNDFNKKLTSTLSLEMLNGHNTELVRRLISLLSYLPSGMPYQGLINESGGQIFDWFYEGRDSLLSFGNVIRAGGRIRLPTIARDYIRKGIAQHNIKLGPDFKKLVQNFNRVACQGNCIGFNGPKTPLKKLEEEYLNIEAMIREGLEFPDPVPAIQTAVAFGRYQRFVGAGTTTLLSEAREAAHYKRFKHLEAECVRVIASMQRQRGELEEALKNYHKAEQLYRHDGNILGQAQSVRGLADTFRQKNNENEARKKYVEAYNSYGYVRRLSDDDLYCDAYCGWTLTCKSQVYRGRADCLKRLGDIALKLGRRQKARNFYKYAKSRYDEVEYCLGKAHCLKGLGDAAMVDRHYSCAQKVYEEAENLYKDVPYLRGVADCLYSRGDLNLVMAINDKVSLNIPREFYDRAWYYYKKLSDLRGIANCTYSFGDISLLESSADKQELTRAKRFYEKALGIYRDISDVLGQANCLRGLVDVMRWKDDKEKESDYQKEYNLLGKTHRLQFQRQSIIYAPRSLSRLSRRWRGG